MNLKNKKCLAARTLGVGAGRIIFRAERLPEISEAITKQDIRDLFESKAIYIKEIKGRLTKEKSGRKGPGKVGKNVQTRKRDYIRLTRKLRKFAKQLLLQGKINYEKHKDIRKKIRAGLYRSKAHFKEIAKPETIKIKTERKPEKKIGKKAEK